jgi:predicted O-methyltransferase YrrM
MHSLDTDFVAQVLDHTMPSFQLASKRNENLGFGYLYYGLVRSLRPKKVVVVGSKAGFAPVCFGRGLLDNDGHRITNIECEDVMVQTDGAPGTLDFIDPSYSKSRNDFHHSHGIGFWDDADRTSRLWDSFGLGAVVTHHRTTSREYLEACPHDLEIDLLYIDGDHSLEGITFDFLSFLPHLAADSVVLAHDVDPSCHSARGFEALRALPADTYEFMRIPVYPGLALMRPIRPDVAARSFRGVPNVGGDHSA